MHAEIETLFQRVLQWYEAKKGPLPIRPELRVFHDLKSYLDFVKPEPGAVESDATCILSHGPDGPKIIIVVNGVYFPGIHPLTRAYIILHELEHAREQTADGVMTFHIMEHPERVRQREVRVSLEAFQLAQEFTGFKMPRFLEEYTKRRFQTEL